MITCIQHDGGAAVNLEVIGGGDHLGIWSLTGNWQP